MKFCAEGGCADVALTGNFCNLHSDPLKRAVRNTPAHVNDAWYGRKEWGGKYGIRGIKIRRNPFCEMEGCQNRANQVHHLKPWKDASDWFLFLGGYDCEFLQSLCAPCHSRITSREMIFGPDKKEAR